MTKKKIMIETDIEKKQRKQKKQTELDKAIKKEKLELIGCNKPQKSMSIFITNQKDRFINKIDDNLEEREYKVLIKKGRTDIIQEKEQEKLMRKMTKKERAEKIKREIEESKDYNLYSWEDIWGLRSDKLYDPKLLCKSLLDSKAITKDKYNQLLDDFKNYFFEKMDPIQNKEEDMLIIQKDKNGDNIYSYVQGKEQNHIIRQAYEYNLCLSVQLRDIIIFWNSPFIFLSLKLLNVLDSSSLIISLSCTDKHKLYSYACRIIWFCSFPCTYEYILSPFLSFWMINISSSLFWIGSIFSKK